MGSFTGMSYLQNQIQHLKKELRWDSKNRFSVLDPFIQCSKFNEREYFSYTMAIPIMAAEGLLSKH